MILATALLRARIPRVNVKAWAGYYASCTSQCFGAFAVWTPSQRCLSITVALFRAFTVQIRIY